MATRATLVLGATGKTGGRAATQLQSRGLPVRLGTRSGPLPFDWQRRETWNDVLNDVDSVYIAYFPDLAVPGASNDIQAFTDLAVRRGVTRLVLLSGRGEPEAQRCEQIVQASAVEWTIVRCSWFSQNFSEGYLVDPIRAGEVCLPAGDVGEPFIDVDDIADVAVAALTDRKHAGQVYELTGPRLLTFAEAVAEIGDACGRELRYVQVPLEAYANVLSQAQVPPDLVGFLSYLFGEVLDGRNARVADGVMRALGRAPRDFRQYARAAAAQGVWRPA